MIRNFSLIRNFKIENLENNTFIDKKYVLKDKLFGGHRAMSDVGCFLSCSCLELIAYLLDIPFSVIDKDG